MTALHSFKPRRLGHLNMFVTDVEKSAAFYADVCGFKEVFREPGISMIFMTNGNTHHDLGLMEIGGESRIGKEGHVQVKPGQGKTPGLNHLGFEMESEARLVDAIDHAPEQGIAVVRTTNHQISHSAYLQDLNGHTLEFYADVIEDWNAFYAANEGELISSHWDAKAATADATPRYPNPTSFHKSESAPIASTHVAYAGLPVRDLAAALRFYRDDIGMRVVHVDEVARFAMFQGTVGDGCDLCLFEMSEFPATRMLFGGVHLHDGRDVSEAVEDLRARGVPVLPFGDASAQALLVIDPDGMPLVYSRSESGSLMRKHGAELPAAIARLKASQGAQA